jgi:cytochrome P450
MDFIAEAVGEVWSVYSFSQFPSLSTDIARLGEIFKIIVLGKQIVFVGNAALCEEICDEKRFRKFVGGPIVEIRYAVHDSLFTAFDNEASWGVHHRILAPLLTPAAVAGHFTEVRDCATELTAKWQALSGDSRVSAIAELNRLDLETTTLCFYGRKLNGLTGPEPPMIKAMDGATSEAIKRPTRPKFVNWLFYGSKFEKDSKTMRQYAAECLQYRKANPTDRKDMLYTMMNAKDPETGKSLDEQQIIDEMVTMPIGSSTAPCAVSSAVYYLLKNPDCITKAREEIDSVVGDGEFTHDHLEKLSYCAGIVRETMRLSAAAPGFNIEPLPGAEGPVLLGGGKYQVPAKQTMIIVLHGVNRDPAVFEEPEAFKPERMVGEAFDKLPEGTKKWFGNGKRVCIGRHYAWMWNMITMVTLLKDVDFEMADPSYQLKQDGWFNLRPVDFYIRVKQRARRDA